MNLKKIASVSALALLTAYSTFGQTRTAISPKELKNLIGCWHGVLNYSGTIIRKPYTVNADLVIKQIGKSNKFEFQNIYPKEPTDNKADTFTISKDGRKINGVTIKLKKYTKEGYLKIITEAAGIDEDSNEAVMIRNTYTIGKSVYKYNKDVQRRGEREWMERQGSEYGRNRCR
jgi:hypothetical protein